VSALAPRAAPRAALRAALRAAPRAAPRAALRAALCAALCAPLPRLALAADGAPPERWLWVQGAHTAPAGDAGCAEALREAHSALARDLSEQLHVALAFDGQTLSCDDAECAARRRDLSGARVALRTSSECLAGALTLRADLSPRGAAPLTYAHGAPLRAAGGAAGEGAGGEAAPAASPHARLGRRVARLVIGGPAPRPAPPPPPALSGGALAGARFALTPHGGGQGLALRAELAHQAPGAAVSWLVTAGYADARGDALSERAVRLSAGARAASGALGLTPLFGADLGVALASRAALVVTSRALAALTTQAMRVAAADALLLTGSLETGLAWRRPALSLLALLRAEPTLAARGGGAWLYGGLESSWSLLVGARW